MNASVVARGLVCSLAHDVVTACAASRAGLTRPSAYHAYAVSEPGNSDGAPLTVHAVSTLTGAFQGPVRLLRLLEGALRDVMSGTGKVPWQSARVGAYLALPASDRTLTGGALLQEEEARKQLDQARHDFVDTPASNPRAILQRAIDLVRFPSSIVKSYVSLSGHTGSAEAVAKGCADLAASAVDLAVIVGADSLLDPVTLRWLETTGRLKTPYRPAGLQPGEACGVLVLTSPAYQKTHGLPCWCHVSAEGSAEDAEPLLEGKPSRGVAMASLVGDALRTQRSGQPVWLISDLDGEQARAAEWANMKVNLQMQKPNRDDIVVWTPAECFGSTGSASGVIGALVASAAFARGYAPSARALVCSASDGPRRTILSVVPPDSAVR